MTIDLGLDFSDIQAIRKSTDPALEPLKKRLEAFEVRINEKIKILNAICDEIEEGSSIHDYAAANAIRVLLENWSPALHEGYELGVLLDDVDEVRTKLANFRLEVEKRITT